MLAIFDEGFVGCGVRACPGRDTGPRCRNCGIAAGSGVRGDRVISGLPRTEHARALAAGATKDEIADVLLAIAPVARLGRVVSAAPSLATALEYDIDAALEEPDDDSGNAGRAELRARPQAPGNRRRCLLPRARAAGLSGCRRLPPSGGCRGRPPGRTMDAWPSAMASSRRQRCRRWYRRLPPCALGQAAWSRSSWASKPQANRWSRSPNHSPPSPKRSRPRPPRHRR